MNGLWFLDGIDLWAAFNIAIEKGSADTLRMPPRKEGIVHDWPDAHGKDYDVSTFFFDEREITLNLFVIHQDEADFWKKHDAFIAQISKPGMLHRLNFKAHGNRNYYVLYKSAGPRIQVKSLKGIPANQVIHKFSINLVEPEPTPNPDAVTAISDEEGRIIIT